MQSPANGKNSAECLYDRFCTFGPVRNSLKREMKKAAHLGRFSNFFHCFHEKLSQSVQESLPLKRLS